MYLDSDFNCQDATTLIIGILVSFFTAVFMTRIVYENKDLYNYFMAMMWYEPKYTPEEYDAKYSTRVFNEYEKANYKLIRQVEKEKGYR